LTVLDERIAARAQATRAAHSWWPCSRGCDLCCRALPRLPAISAPEWERLRDALADLSPEARAAIVARAHEAPAVGPLTCPILDVSSGACLLYDARPIACRTYGFYTERDGGLHCSLVAQAVEENAGEMAVVWGNGEAVADDLRSCGETRSLLEWMTDVSAD
jgi:Fe-S-cluster containining protein